ncbi:MAG: RNA methyltransferase [Pseudomonadota bacterium]
MLSRIQFVLSHPSHPGNVGAAARAMKTMGLSRLTLINPKNYPSADATARASGAHDVLSQARVVDSLDEALTGVHLILGTSARLRRIALPQLSAREAADQAAASDDQTQIAVLFGTEKSGLSNAEIDRCHALLNIPSNPDYSSLNLGAAVQVVSYELRVAALQRDGMEPERMAEHQPAPAEQLAGLLQHLDDALADSGFYDGKQTETLKARVRRMAQRLAPAEAEIHLLRGMLAHSQRKRD